MFGYINVYKDELKIKDFRRYRAFYCGVCRSLGEKYGLTGRLTLSYDMTFLAMLLTSLYEDDVKIDMHRCIVHPVKAHETICNEYTDYAAAMNVMLTYYKLKDDWEDDGNVVANSLSFVLSRAFSKARYLYPEQAKAIKRYIRAQKKCEQRNEKSIDRAATPTGELLSYLFDYRHDVWGRQLNTMGFFIGKFIYIMDAYEDVFKDIKKSDYNPFRDICASKSFDDNVKSMLTMLAAECAKAYEHLPIVDNDDIIKNILFAGIWGKYNEIRTKRTNNK